MPLAFAAADKGMLLGPSEEALVPGQSVMTTSMGSHPAGEGGFVYSYFEFSPERCSYLQYHSLTLHL